MSAQLIKQLREQRMSWVELEEGKSVRIIRPTQLEMVSHLLKDGRVVVGIEEVKLFVVDWSSGFTEAALLGAAVGASDPIPFTPALWAEVVSDKTAWVRIVSQALLDMVIQYGRATEDAEKN